MKKYISAVIVIFLFVAVALTTKGWSEDGGASGYYDAENDWFVLEWDNPEYGWQVTVYDPPNKVKPVISATIEFDSDKKEYRYIYEVANNEGAVQVLESIFVEYSSPVYEAEVPFPVEDWYSEDYERKSAWQWGKSGGDIYGIPAGHMESGLSFKSKGIPAINDAYFFGDQRKIFSGPGDTDTEEVTILFDEIFERLEEEYKEKFKTVIKRTVGPGELPEEQTPIETIESLIKMKHEAQDLGWIKAEGGDGIIQALDSKLDNAKKAIDKGNKKSARRILEAFVLQVEAQGCATSEGCPEGKHLSPEAYALLKFNAEYLISELDE